MARRGAQSVRVPRGRPNSFADRESCCEWRAKLISMLGIFVFLFIALDLMVHHFVTRRIARMSRLADQVSLGQFTDEEFDTRAGDRLSVLARSFARMPASLARDMNMLDARRGPP